MCNINAVIKNNNSKENYVSRLMSATSVSYSENNYAEGLFTNYENNIVTNTNKIDLYKYKDDIIMSNVVIAHERLATSGFCSSNTQPLRLGNWILAHNGIFGKTHDDKSKSDSVLFLEIFTNNLKKSSDIVSAINQSLKDIDFGTYSILLYNTESKKLYYFKNSSTNIKFYSLINNDLYITTNSTNKLFFETKFEYNIKDNTLYQIEYNLKKIAIYKLSKLEKVKSYFTRNDLDCWKPNKKYDYETDEDYETYLKRWDPIY